MRQVHHQFDASRCTTRSRVIGWASLGTSWTDRRHRASRGRPWRKGSDRVDAPATVGEAKGAPADVIRGAHKSGTILALQADQTLLRAVVLI